MRRLAVLCLATGLVLALAVAPTVAQDAVPNLPPFDHIAGGNVVPPGNNGHVPAPQAAAAVAGTYAAPHSTDQRDLYVAWERKDWSFATAEDLAGMDGPVNPAGRDDVAIWTDDWGVPRIFGESDAATSFGIGYAMASQRLFQADVFRHVARGEMASFLGGQEWFDYDRAWRREFYTDDELLGMLEARASAEERALIQAYLDGLNAYIAEALTDPQKLPAEYVALGIVPEPWALEHALSVFVLQARDAVEGFGQELANAALLADLTASLGEDEAREVFADLRWYRDPGAYATTPRDEATFAYPGGGFDGLDAEGVAVPDDPAEVGAVAAEQAAMVRALEAVGLARKQASNAIAVSGDLTASGEPILLGGPQLDYLVPGIFWEFEAHSPNIHARGIGFAGTAGAILIGRSSTHSWSITYGYTDQVDVFLVPLDPDRPTTHYLRDGETRPLQTYETTVTCKIDQASFAGSPDADALCDGAPVAQEVVTVARVPEYGPVIGEVDVDGAPHAVVKVRGHWMREVDNGRPFLTFNRPGTIADFRGAQDDFTVSLNLNYVDDQGHAGFWHVARAPVRAAGTDVRLPTIGDGSHDWQGFLDLDEIPHAIDPEQGYTANWNNQISAGWHNGDQNSWGDVQRIDVIDRGMRELATRGDITPEDIWGLNREAAYADVRFEHIGDRVLGLLEGGSWSGAEAAALQTLSTWDGQRTSSEDEGTIRYDDPAVAIWDALFIAFQEAVFADELGEHYARLFDDLDVDFYYLAMPVVTRVLLGDAAPLPAAHDWLDGVDLATAVRTAFVSAVGDLAERFGSSDATAWLGEAVLTTYREVGVGSAEPHAKMNRGTYNQLAIVDTGGDAGAGPGAVPDGAADGAPLPATGGGAVVAGLAVLAAAVTRRRRPPA